MTHRVLAPEDFPESARTPAGLAAFLDRQDEDGWRFVGNVGRLAVFRRAPALTTPATVAPARRTANLVDDDD